jgi:hypothetical protein
MSLLNVGHGWVTPRADGVVAKCGGPKICGECQAEAALRQQLADVSNERDEVAKDRDSLAVELLQAVVLLNASEARNTALTGSLSSMTTNYVCALEAGYERITRLGGDCDSVEKMMNDNPEYIRAMAVLAQSAPATKVDCGNCSFVVGVCVTECESAKIRAARLSTATDEQGAGS